jgi:hypothetical protein
MGGPAYSTLLALRGPTINPATMRAMKTVFTVT